jgi:hypothetical protein
MPVSDKYKCIFLHVPKTGGSTIENILKPISLYGPYRGNTLAPQHLIYNDIQKFIPQDKFKSYWKFTMVRNPWDRIVSDYHWNSRGYKTFQEFIYQIREFLSLLDPFTDKDFKNKIKGHFLPQILYINDDVHVYRYENYSDSLKDISIRLQLKLPDPIPQIGKTKHDHYSKYYTPELIDIVSKLYKDDIERFNYKFDR